MDCSKGEASGSFEVLLHRAKVEETLVQNFAMKTY